MLNRLLVALLVILPTALAANFIHPRERIVLPVRPIDATAFEVVENDGAGGTQIWCAAGIYARNVLKQNRAEVTVQRARGASEVFLGRNSVIFTTAPVAGAFKSTSQGVTRAGHLFTAAHAYALCRSNPEQWIRIRIISG